MKKYEIVKDLNGKFIVRIHNGMQILKEYKPTSEKRANLICSQLKRKGYEYSLM